MKRNAKSMVEYMDSLQPIGFEEFVACAVRTASMYPKVMGSEQEINLVHSIEGLIAEWLEYRLAYTISEFDDRYHYSYLVEELGDMFWYLAIGWNAIRRNSRSSISRNVVVSPRDIVCILEELAALKKAYLFYGIPFPKRKIGLLFRELFFALRELFRSEPNLDLERVLAVNVAKLKRRYPKKFTKKAAIIRADKR